MAKKALTPITLPDNPVGDLDAAPKQYVDGAVANRAVVYVHNGTSYVQAPGRIFIGPEDPSADGFTLTNGDQWINPTA